MAPTAALHLAVQFEGCGRHPAAWRERDARPAALFDARRAIDLVRRAERGMLDFVLFDDSFASEPDDARAVRGRLDALLTAARVAPHTASIGLVPTVTTTHTEPFHVSKNVATLDWVSAGRAGWNVAVSPTDAEAELFGRKAAAPPSELYEEAADAVEVVRRLWDSWEDDAVIRDVRTGRYVDRDKLHYVDFGGRFFSVRGPSITPRPPQGQPPVVVAASGSVAATLVALHGDIALVAAEDLARHESARARIDAQTHAAGRDPRDVSLLAVVDVLFEADDRQAAASRRRLDDLADAVASSAFDFTGTPLAFASIAEAWFRSGAVDGFLLRPARLPRDLDAVVDALVPALRSRGLFRMQYEDATLRARFGLGRPANRYATVTR